MPVLELHLVDGDHAPDRHARLLELLSRRYAEVLESPLERVRAYLTLHPREHWAVGGSTHAEPAPYFTAIVLEGRPVEQRHRLLAATTDLIDAEAGVVGEYESELHLDRRQRAKDVRREGDLRAHDLEVVTMTSADGTAPSHFIGRLHAAYRTAARRPRSDRTWTITPPPWWVPTHTVELRRALTEDQRRRFLRYRRA